MRVAWTLWLELLSLFQIQIAIGIGVAIVLLASVVGSFLANLVAPPAQPTEHGRHAVEFMLAALALRFVQRFAHNQNVLNGGALQGRSSRDLEVAPPVGVGGLAVAAQQCSAESTGWRAATGLAPRDGYRSVLLISHTPTQVADGESINVQFLVSKSHLGSTPIAIPISISIFRSQQWVDVQVFTLLAFNFSPVL